MIWENVQFNLLNIPYQEAGNVLSIVMRSDKNAIKEAIYSEIVGCSYEIS